MSEARINGATTPVDRESSVAGDDKLELRLWPVSYTHLTLPTTPYV